MKKAMLALAALVLVMAVSCGTAEAPKSPVTLVVAGVSTGYDTIEDAIAAIPSGAEGTLVLNQDVCMAANVAISDKSVSITDGGCEVIITDTIEGESDYVYVFQVSGTGKLSIEASETGKITFYGRYQEVANSKRVMFDVGPQGGDKSPNATLYLGKNVVIDNQFSAYSGSIMRGYGNFTLNGVTIQNSWGSANGMAICLYGKAVVEDATIKNCQCGGNGGLFQVTNTDGASLTINGGLFQGNYAAALGGVVNSYAKSNVVINGGTFTKNSVTGAGGAIYCLGTWQINGGTFEGNVNGGGLPAYDVYVKDASKVTIGANASIKNLFMPQ